MASLPPNHQHPMGHGTPMGALRGALLRGSGRPAAEGVQVRRIHPAGPGPAVRGTDSADARSSSLTAHDEPAGRGPGCYQERRFIGINVHST